MSEDDIVGKRNCDISLFTLIFACSTVILYLFIYSFAQVIYKNKKDIDYIWMLIISIVGGALITAIIFGIRYMLYVE